MQARAQGDASLSITSDKPAYRYSEKRSFAGEVLTVITSTKCESRDKALLY
jgi:hypothetical protein